MHTAVDFARHVSRSFVAKISDSPLKGLVRHVTLALARLRSAQDFDADRSVETRASRQQRARKIA